MTLPKVGLHHKDGLEKAKRFAKMPFKPAEKVNLVNSVVNQVRLAEGDKSAKSINKEIAGDMNSSSWHDNPKARPQGFVVNICLKECKFQGTNVCEDCIGNCMYEPINKEE